MTNAAIVAIEIVETAAMPEPGDDRRRGKRQLDADERLQRGQAHAARRLLTSAGTAAKALEDVPVEDQQRVGDERDLDRRHGQAGDRDEQLEEREARDRVEEVGEEADRLVEPAIAVRDAARRPNAITKPIATAIPASFRWSRSAG